MPKATKDNARKQFDTSVDLIQPKSKALSDIGIPQRTAERFERLAKHPEAVEKAKAKAQRLRTLCKDGRLQGVSYAFEVLDADRVRMPGGKTARRIKEVELYEISITPRPTNDRARVTSVKEGSAVDQMFRTADALLLKYTEGRKRKAAIEAARRLLGEK